MTIDGKGPFQIARILTDERVTRPSTYIALRDGRPPSKADDPYQWGGATVRNILSHLEYTGSTVNFRTYKESYKDKNHKHHPKEEWAVFEGTQEPIVDMGTWRTAQKCRRVIRRNNSKGIPNPLTGLVYCADCGSRMYNHIGTLAWKYDSQDSYGCSRYCKYPHKCTTHYIKTSALRALVLETIKRVSGYVRVNEEEFVRRIREESEVRSAEAAKAKRDQLAKSQKRHAELDAIIKRLYEDKVTGSLSAKRFDALSSEYEEEQDNLERRIEELQAGLERFSEDSQKADKFIEVVRRYTDFTELTPAMLNEFVEKIVVHEAEGAKQGHGRFQKVEIWLNFIGQFKVPGYEEPELKPFDPVEHQREIWRNYYHRHKDEIKADKAKRAEEKKKAKLAAMPVKTPEEIEEEAIARKEKHRAYHREYQREWQRRRKEALKENQAMV
jgi:hypothetical protein